MAARMPLTWGQTKWQIDPRISELCDAGKVEEYPSEAFEPIARGLLEIAPEPRRSPVQPE